MQQFRICIACQTNVEYMQAYQAVGIYLLSQFKLKASAIIISSYLFIYSLFFLSNDINCDNKTIKSDFSDALKTEN